VAIWQYVQGSWFFKAGVKSCGPGVRLGPAINDTHRYNISNKRQYDITSVTDNCLWLVRCLMFHNVMWQGGILAKCWYSQSKANSFDSQWGTAVHNKLFTPLCLYNQEV